MSHVAKLVARIRQDSTKKTILLYSLTFSQIWLIPLVDECLLVHPADNNVWISLHEFHNNNTHSEQQPMQNFLFSL
jgi:hypothetical protein